MCVLQGKMDQEKEGKGTDGEGSTSGGWPWTGDRCGGRSVCKSSEDRSEMEGMSAAEEAG